MLKMTLLAGQLLSNVSAGFERLPLLFTTFIAKISFTEISNSKTFFSMADGIVWWVPCVGCAYNCFVPLNSRSQCYLWVDIQSCS